VRYAFEDYVTVFRLEAQKDIVYRWTSERGLDVHAPRTVVRVIRYANQHLGWNPEKNPKPLIIANGYQLLKDVGYDVLD